MDIHLISYYIGISIVFFTNLYILFNLPSPKTISYYAYVNLLGAVFIAYYFMYKEEFIDF